MVSVTQKAETMSASNRRYTSQTASTSRQVCDSVRENGEARLVTTGSGDAADHRRSFVREKRRS